MKGRKRHLLNRFAEHEFAIGALKHANAEFQQLCYAYDEVAEELEQREFRSASRGAEEDLQALRQRREALAAEVLAAIARYDPKNRGQAGRPTEA